MRIAYFDCFAGVAGDMTLGALIDLGVAPEQIDAAVRSLGVDDFRLEVTDDERSSIGGKRVQVHSTGQQPHRHLRHIVEILQRGDLSPAVRARAIDVFTRLTEAEARVHRKPVQSVHLHEVGALDAIVDVVGACVGLELLAIDEIVCAPVVVGGGMTRGAHGPIPIPGPATVELLMGKPCRSGPVESEMTTPTGAALVTTLASSFGPIPDMTLAAVGYGCGSRSFDEVPNLLRIVVGERATGDGVTAGSAVVIEANVDDASPEVLAHAASRLLAEGALDAWQSPIVMKKGRAGVVVTVLAEPGHVERLTAILFAETSTIGVRISDVQRRLLSRRHDVVETPYGAIRVKVASAGDRVLNAAPEHDDCVRAAAERGVALKEVQASAAEAWRRARPTPS